MPEPVETPAAALMRLTNGYQISQAIHVAAVLRLADFVGAEPVAAEEIAPRVGAHPRSLYRLLRALSTVGIFRETKDKRFVGSAMSDLLRTDHPRSMWGWPAYIGRPRHREIWGDLLHSVRTGQDAPHHLWGVDGYQHLAMSPLLAVALARSSAPAEYRGVELPAGADGRLACARRRRLACTLDGTPVIAPSSPPRSRAAAMTAGRGLCR